MLDSLTDEKIDYHEQVYIAELARRTALVRDRDGVTNEKSVQVAADWIASELGAGQLEMPITFNTYIIYYHRTDDHPASDYQLVLVRLEGQLYKWVSSNDVLRDIIKNQFDPDCETVITFHKYTE